jgi:hypothetical protein
MMPDFRGTFDAGFGRETDDPILNLIAAACDVWTVGASLLQTFAQQTGAVSAQRDQEAVADPDSTLLGVLEGFAASLGELVARRAEVGLAAKASGSGDTPPNGDLSSLMVQTWMICATSTLRYWRDLTHVYARYQHALIQSVARRATHQCLAPESDDRVLVDELRAYLREIGDAAVREGRRLQTELERIGEAVARGLEPDSSEFYQRRWKVKD